MSERREPPKHTINLLKFTITDQENEVLGEFTSNGYNLREQKQLAAFIRQVIFEIDRTLNPLRVNYDPWYAVQEICESFDSRVIPDMIVDEWETDKESGDDVPVKTRSVIYIGGGDLSAGIHHYSLTPCFETYPELEDWCRKRIKQFRQYADKPEIPLPDTTKWEEDSDEEPKA